MTGTAIVTAKNVSKQYGSKTAVDHVSLTVNLGDVYALIGQNGAGKTTLLRMIVGLEKPDIGEIRILNLPMSLAAVAAKGKIGYVPDNPAGFEYVTGREFLYYSGSLRGMERTYLDNKISKLLQIFPVIEIADAYLGSLSRGNRQKFAVLSALLSDPELLVIDEPIVGLDPASISILGSLLSDYAQRGKAVLLVTHILDFAVRYATRVGIMRTGCLKEEIVPQKLRSLTDL
jgi:ABC-2 type transport system ATP-binding protein